MQSSLTLKKREILNHQFRSQGDCRCALSSSLVKMSSEDERELQPLIGDVRKRPGCCANHPWLCSCTLTLILALCLAVILFGGIFGSRLDQAVQDAIAEVMFV